MKRLIIIAALFFLGLSLVFSMGNDDLEKRKKEIKKLETQLQGATGRERINLLIKLGEKYFVVPNQYAAIIEYGQKALKQAEAEDLPEMQVSAMCLMSKGYRIMHDYQEGYQVGQKALTLAKSLKNKKKIKEAYNFLIDLCSYWDYTKALQHQKELRQFVEDDHELASWNQVMAHMYLNISKPDLEKAKNYVSKASELYKKTGDYEKHARMLIYLAGFLRRDKKFPQALGLIDKAHQIALKHNTPYAAARALDAKARVYLAEKSYEKSIAIFEQSRNYSKIHKFEGMVQSVHYHLADLYLELNQPRKALEEIEPLYDYCVEYDYFWLPGVAMLKGDILAKLGKKPEAWEAYWTALAAAGRFRNNEVIAKLIPWIFVPWK